VRRGRALDAARREVAEARQQLEDRKLVERAKGLLMRRTGMSEQDAYSAMRRQSQDRSQRMVDVARAVLDSEPGRRSA
jgi:response regulator NasT